MRTPNPELHIPPALQRGNTYRAVSRVARSAHGGLGAVQPAKRPVYKKDARLAREAAAEQAAA